MDNAFAPRLLQWPFTRGHMTTKFVLRAGTAFVALCPDARPTRGNPRPPPQRAVVPPLNRVTLGDIDLRIGDTRER